jgi:hypothetical protein
LKNKAILYPKIFLPAIGGFVNQEMVALGRAGPGGTAEGIERVEDPGPEPRNVG